MADTISDVSVSNTVYTDLNTVSGIAPGTALVLTNKSSSPMRVQVSVGQPADASEAGEILEVLPFSTAIKIVTQGSNTVWAKSLANTTGTKLSVQVYA